MRQNAIRKELLNRTCPRWRWSEAANNKTSSKEVVFFIPLCHRDCNVYPDYEEIKIILQIYMRIVSI